MPRRLELVCGAQGECLQRSAALLPADVPAVWITTAPGIAGALPANKAHTLLGQETGALVFDAHSGFDVNAFAAVSGTLRGGGTLYLLTPPLDAWAQYPDPDYRRFLPYPYQAGDVEGLFLQRLVGMLEEKSPLAPLLQRGGFLQQDAVITIIQSEVPVVLTADRGRGKSAALGMAASQLIGQGKRVMLTAPSRATVESVFKHAANPPAFFAPDDLLQTLPKADVLMVDEAAAIPVPLLLQMLQHYPRCVFSTTLHGYEGSGRGFVLRFQKQLDTLAPGWQSIRLHQPIRWPENDPLEHFINQALLLDVDLAPCPPCGGRAGDGGERAEYRQLNRDNLAQNEPLLRQLFGLLVTAHYQTRPSDLRQMLDAPNISIHILEQQGIIVAVALLSREGGIDADLTAAIHAGTRRPHGHPIPQTLTFHAKIPQAAQLVCERVMRIAVHPDRQNHGLGAQLLKHLLGFATQGGADYMGVSYAMTPELVRFWERAGFVVARVGHRKDTASGSRSVVQIKALTARATALFNR
ncbi:MAG TPA: GNAT family N-acetyltransferase [Candidatus Thiothrix moscowensis]|uniref:tRNA(Met) cytidine acetyltransferase TmcA n=1 Tax=unclassified Thiothrix TaxID=2636184 RepID=UPI0025D2D0A0|nr:MULTISPECIES: GNAT family N-acetyltransferase [unclassified Thiothrix]HRJ51150.1 GNAT family N-acetyltransferase [Candidatus Thiothrix moscowensis]HRJ91795.1 GNAT family N-acetyltransferase [Candidatus Thiothrix moscowensis]